MSRAEGRSLQDGVDVLWLPIQLTFGGQSVDVDACASVWLCPSCPNVHVNLELGPNSAISLQLTDLEAEALGKALISPQPIDPRHLKKEKRK